MPDLRFLNVRFNLDDPGESAIYTALTDYPAGARSQVVRAALAAHLRIEARFEEGSASRRERSGAQKKKANSGNLKQGQPAPKDTREDGLDKKPEVSSGAVTAPGMPNDQEQKPEEVEAVKGFLSMLH
jgi:hypothetical protein